MTAPAAAQDGKRDWERVYPLLQGADYGTVVPYAALCAVLGVASVGPKVYGAVGRAAKYLRKHDLKSPQNVVNIGYRILLPAEHERQAEVHKSKSRRQMVTALTIYQGTNLELLDSEQQERTVRQISTTRYVLSILSNHESRLCRIETLLNIRESGLPGVPLAVVEEVDPPDDPPCEVG